MTTNTTTKTTTTTTPAQKKSAPIEKAHLNRDYYKSLLISKKGNPSEVTNKVIDEWVNGTKTIAVAASDAIDALQQARFTPNTTSKQLASRIKSANTELQRFFARVGYGEVYTLTPNAIDAFIQQLYNFRVKEIDGKKEFLFSSSVNSYSDTYKYNAIKNTAEKFITAGLKRSIIEQMTKSAFSEDEKYLYSLIKRAKKSAEKSKTIVTEQILNDKIKPLASLLSRDFTAIETEVKACYPPTIVDVDVKENKTKKPATKKSITKKTSKKKATKTVTPTPSAETETSTTSEETISA